MAATHTTDETANNETTQTTLDGDRVEAERPIREELSGTALLLYLIGESLDDPDPARAAKWIARIKAEGMVK
ncbi:hypothetical protein [Natrinema sp. 1APR25-10V2]|uniref:hypothetical protein n=1 Tax=Natrinema sp. 1APR25-10V2 TaxID=2951081 RepID=UPI002876AF27|nr:hypothetical protein [Natrinema sp. 1APR25-10V2]MDS0478670.1 hypothetical protein [Natrinema sp. 1APR25-10V2]